VSVVGSAEEVDALARRLYGEVPRETGVLHVTACWRSPEGALETMAIRQETPKSVHDFFALELARARADVVVVSGKILRDEPGLRYDLSPPLREWRAQDEPPLLLVLTSGRGLDVGHPAFRSWARPVVFTSEEAARQIEGVKVVAHPEPSPAAAIEWARARGGTVSVELGPKSSGPLHEAGLVDELLLSVFHGELEDDLRAGTLGDEAAILSRFENTSSPVSVEEPSGRWSFRRAR